MTRETGATKALAWHELNRHIMSKFYKGKIDSRRSVNPISDNENIPEEDAQFFWR
jgi:hypothetical protein